MLIGEYQHKIDKKGRLAVPKKLREDLSSRLVVTKGLDRCLFIYSFKEWQLIVEKLKKLPFTNSDARSFVRFMLAGAYECELDSLGRINLPDYLIQFAQLEKEVTVVGLFNRVEIWSGDNWDKYSDKMEKNTDVVAEQFADLGI